MTHKPVLDRRTLLASSVAMSALPLAVGPQTYADEASPKTSSPPSSPSLAREQLLFDFDWQFTFGHGADPTKDLGFGFGQADFSKTGKFAFAKVGYNDTSWRTLNLPHDWAVELPFVHDDAGEGDDQLRSHGYKPLGRRYPETSVGWYRREFDIPKTDAGRRIWVEFDGAFRDVLVFVNGCFIGRSHNGYVPFRFDITDFLIYGGKNAIAVRVDATYGDGWFYEGAGLYRHVWMLKTDSLYFDQWETTIRSTLMDAIATLDLRSQVHNKTKMDQIVSIVWDIYGPDGLLVTSVTAEPQSVTVDDHISFHGKAEVSGLHLWSPESPHLYTARARLMCDGQTRDAEDVSFGIRSTVFDPDKGFILNGKRLKIKGVCNHQDHAGVGAAVPDRLQAYRVEVMQSMGCNAIRTTHNMPTPELVAACDRLGMMLTCETRQLSSSLEGLEQLEVMIKRFRNSPSVIIWSIGNEEYLLQTPMAEQGERIAASMVQLCHKLDPTRVVSTAVNESNEGGVSVPVDIVGFNYNQSKYPDAFHKKYPARPLFGSETSSAISTRGEYVTDAKANIVNSYDGVVGWGETPESWWKFHATRDWEAGGFAWTGFDYRGEPTPYGWPSINSQFGIVDMCGFPKDYFYYYRAWWRPEPSLHLFPHWNWHGKEGQEMSIWVYSNLDEVELLVNGRSQGRKAMPALGHLEWKAPFTAGAIEARGFKGGRRVLTERRETTGVSRHLKLTTDQKTLAATGEDIAVVRVEALDHAGRFVATANDALKFRVSGPGTIIGLGNGNPNSLESDKGLQRRLFNGLAQVIVQSTKAPGLITIEAWEDKSGSGIQGAYVRLPSRAADCRPFVA